MTQASPVVVNPRSPLMDGSATFTIVLSMTMMNCTRASAARASHRCRPRAVEADVEVVMTAFRHPDFRRTPTLTGGGVGPENSWRASGRALTILWKDSPRGIGLSEKIWVLAGAAQQFLARRRRRRDTVAGRECSTP